MDRSTSVSAASSVHQSTLTMWRGVRDVDSGVADSLVRAAWAFGLVGAQVVLAGIKPSVAQTLVALGVDLGSIMTSGTLQSGIRYALQQMRPV
ncbi:STAS domain-containing protein [Sorangium sp. So ce117]|uniref:STAS domain-containing protein n=1 Tax=Sorangium sp. So ce117 TaxID=3133277 RepID=UPI003F5F9B59